MPKCKKAYDIPWGRYCNAECIFCHTMRQKENGGWSCNKVSAHLICTLPCWEYSTHRNSWYSPECTCISLVGCTDLCTLPLLPQTAIDPSVVVVTCAAVPQATQRDRGKHSRGVDSCWCLQSAAMPDGFPIDFLVLSQFFFTTSPLRCQRCAAEDFLLLRWALVTCVLEVWFMNWCRQEYSFWQQKQIMEETEWSNLWPLPHD